MVWKSNNLKKITTLAITAADINKLRQMTSAGMIDCRKALIEAQGNFEKAIDIITKKGQNISVNLRSIESKKSDIPDTCPHCKSPNTKMLRECEWCGSQIV